MMKNQTLTKDVQEAKLMDANISKTEAETEKVKAETTKLYADEDARVVEMRKIHAEICKLSADAAKAQRETRYYPVAVMTGVASAVVFATMAFAKYFSS